jgi:hypothetical protein
MGKAPEPGTFGSLVKDFGAESLRAAKQRICNWKPSGGRVRDGHSVTT